MLDASFYGPSFSSIYPSPSVASFRLCKQSVTERELLADLLRVLVGIPS